MNNPGFPAPLWALIDGRFCMLRAQKGFEASLKMFLYPGAMLAFRNPRAHETVEDNPEKALEYIAFLSLLAKSLDKAKRA